MQRRRIFYVDPVRFDEPEPLAQVDPKLARYIAAGAATLSIGVRRLRWKTTLDILVYPQDFDEDYQPTSGARIAAMAQAQGPIHFL